MALDLEEVTLVDVDAVRFLRSCGCHFAMWEYPELFAGELRAAFQSIRGGPVATGR